MSKQAKPKRVDRELEEFRSLMTPPSKFEDGFTWAAFFGAIFVALLMVPGAIYMTLIAGVGTVSTAAQWVTVILFIEVARRANKSLRKAEIFTLFYLSGGVMAAASAVQGGFHGGMHAIWSQFYVQSSAAAAAGITEHIPDWVAPSDPEVLDQRNMLMWEWLPALGLVSFTMLIGRIDNMVLGYGLFRLTSDLEKLPFPMAPVQAQGIMALSEEQEEESRSVQLDDTEHTDEDEAAGEAGGDAAGRWRWRVFSIGAVIGLAFGLVYLGLPTVTGALLGEPITIIPIPFIDYTADTANLLPAVAVALAIDLGQVIMGMVLPFWAMVGSFVGLLVTFVLNPVLYAGTAHWLPDWIPVLGTYDGGTLTQWSPGDNMQETFYKNNIDFYFSFSIGIGMAIAVAGIWSVAWSLARIRKERQLGGTDMESELYAVPEGRGDIRTWFIFLTYFIVTAMYIGVSMWLLWITDEHGQGWHWGVFAVMVFYSMIYTPLISYVTTRLEGIAGEVINIPFVREASFILSGYHGVAVWFLPVPQHNYSTMAVFYRSCELTGTKFWSIWKSEILLTPIVLIGSLAFAHFIWRMGPIPGPTYLYAQEWWEVTAAQQSIVFSSTLGGFTEFEQAFNTSYILWGLVIGGATFAAFNWIGAPVFLVYGIVRGLGQTLPFAVIPQFIGALIGRYYFQKKLGLMWRQYIPVVAAGFSCGMGLVATLGIGFTFLAKSVFELPY
ncbi:peptide transporter [Phycisphaerales bacterium AB-hyl4]|uniref:Peptide transporter n=1 Tax=Natronomicrosphaera hydrolytica TaxID=3242702 RepID=A0ABV4UC55_9BACT